MAYTLLTHVSKGSIGLAAVTTNAIDTTGANLLIEGICYLSAFGVATPQDNKSNTYTKLTIVGGGTDVVVAYNQGGNVGTGHTFSEPEGNASALCASSFSGAAASPADQQNGFTNSGLTSIQAGSITPSEDNCLVIAFLGYDGNDPGDVAVDSGFTIIENVGGSAGNCLGGVLAYKIQTTAAAVNPQWTWTGSRVGVAKIASFKTGAAGATGFGQPLGGRRNNPVAMFG